MGTCQGGGYVSGEDPGDVEGADMAAIRVVPRCRAYGR